MENLRQALITTRAQVRRLQSTLIELEPTRGQLRWLGGRRHRPVLRFVFRDAQDVLNHAATLTGYFDGYAARGAYQQHVARALAAPDSDRLSVLFPYLREVLAALEQVLSELIEREPLALAPAGPRKPGPGRTLELCSMHLAHIEQKVCAMVLNLTSSKALQQRAQQHLDDG